MGWRQWSIGARELSNDLERLGPTFVKIGQLLSSRADLLPESYVQAFSRLQDKVKPFSYPDVEFTVEAELGTRISKAFSCFNPEPLAAASLGQVHCAALHDGRPVVVKVQRPNIVWQVGEDFAALEKRSKLCVDRWWGRKRMAIRTRCSASPRPTTLH